VVVVEVPSQPTEQTYNAALSIINENGITHPACQPKTKKENTSLTLLSW
jgi:hypothetical protein